MIPLQEFLDRVKELRGDTLSQPDTLLLTTAYNIAKKAHEGQLRKNGEPYFFGHCIPVAYNVASLGMSASMIASGLLHDTLEDTDLTKEELIESCGGDVYQMVEGVSKLSKVRYQGNERHVESLRKFFVAVAQDVRVVILKLCDRVHNLETLLHLEESKRQRIARESILIHAQLAARLGMGQLAVLINDLAFPYAYPKEFERTRGILEQPMMHASKVIEEMYALLPIYSEQVLGYVPDIDKRVKGMYSSFLKLERKDWNVDELHDLIALRIIVKTTEDCYKTLGMLHSHWPPLPGRLKDYIAMPKPNGYKSLHTTLMSRDGLKVEVQIKTIEMHHYAEFGIASHHSYKAKSERQKQSFEWLSQLSALKDEALSPDEYVHELESDFFSTRIFALTPGGDVIDLPAGATAIDFAYAVHSDIGDIAKAAKINGTYAPLSRAIPSEAVVEIITSKGSKPVQKWLSWAHTSHAKNKIRKRLSSLQTD
jgi:GTP pyrophosphokinase